MCLCCLSNLVDMREEHLRKLHFKIEGGLQVCEFICLKGKDLDRQLFTNKALKIIKGHGWVSFDLKTPCSKDIAIVKVWIYFKTNRCIRDGLLVVLNKRPGHSSEIKKFRIVIFRFINSKVKVKYHIIPLSRTSL